MITVCEESSSDTRGTPSPEKLTQFEKWCQDIEDTIMHDQECTVDIDATPAGCINIVVSYADGSDGGNFTFLNLWEANA